MGIQKGFLLGLAQAFVNVVLYGGIAIIFWYGPYLIRTECKNYSAGHWMVVCIPLADHHGGQERRVRVGVHLLFDVHVFAVEFDSEHPIVRGSVGLGRIRVRCDQTRIEDQYFRRRRNRAGYIHR